MADCFSKALELEGEYQVGEVVSPGMDFQVMSATGQLVRRYTRPIPVATQNQSKGPQPTTQTPVITVRRLDTSRGIALS